MIAPSLQRRLSEIEARDAGVVCCFAQAGETWAEAIRRAWPQGVPPKKRALVFRWLEART